MSILLCSHLILQLLLFFLVFTNAFQFHSKFLNSISLHSNAHDGSLHMSNRLDSISLNVRDLSSSIAFYTTSLGMQILSQNVNDAFVGYNMCSNCVKLHLTEKKDISIMGDNFFGISIKTPDALIKFSKATALGSKVITPFDSYAYGASMLPDEDEMKTIPVKYGKIQDPDGYVVEVIEGKSAQPFYKVKFNVLDLNDAVQFYNEKLKMNILRRRSNVNNEPKEASLCAFLGYGTEDDGALIELIYQYSNEKLKSGDHFKDITIQSNHDFGGFQLAFDDNERYELSSKSFRVTDLDKHDIIVSSCE